MELVLCLSKKSRNYRSRALKGNYWENHMYTKGSQFILKHQVSTMHYIHIFSNKIFSNI